MEVDSASMLLQVVASTTPSHHRTRRKNRRMAVGLALVEAINRKQQTRPFLSGSNQFSRPLRTCLAHPHHNLVLHLEASAHHNHSLRRTCLAQARRNLRNLCNRQRLYSTLAHQFPRQQQAHQTCSAAHLAQHLPHHKLQHHHLVGSDSQAR